MALKSYVPRGTTTPRTKSYVLPGRRRRGRAFPTPGGGPVTEGGFPGRRPSRGVSATPPRRPAPVYRPVVSTSTRTNYAKLTMPSRKGSGPFGDSELRAGYRKMEGALGRADQPGVKAALETRIRYAKGEPPPAMTRGQHTAMLYTAAKEKSTDIKKKRQGVAARILLREQGY